MKISGFKKTDWKNGIWVTRAALVLGALAIGIGLFDSSLYQLNLFAFLVLLVLGLSMVGIVMMLWRVERRSRRLRAPIFWLSLVANLLLISVVGILYYRSLSLPRMQKSYLQVPAAPDRP